MVYCLIGAAATLIAGAIPLLRSDPSTPRPPTGSPQDIKPASRRGEAYFHYQDNRLEAHDLKADGYGVRAYLIAGPRKVRAEATDDNPWGENQLADLKDGTHVWLQICWRKAGKDFGCSGTQPAIA
jgi:hypothetical protein